MNFNDEELVNNMSSIALVNNMAFLSTSERKNVLNNSNVLNKLRSELLKECNNGNIYYNFRKVFDILDLDDIFKIFDYDIIYNFYKKLTIKDFPNYKNDCNNSNCEELSEISKKISDSYNRKRSEYKLFVCLLEKDPDKVMEWILSDNNLFREVMLLSDDMYSIFASVSYDVIARTIYKLEEINFIKESIGCEFISCLSSDFQMKLLEEGFTDDTLIKIISYFRKDVVSYFFEFDKRSIYLYKKIKGIRGFVKDGVKFNREILIRDDFFDLLKEADFIEFRKNINSIEKHNDPMIIEKKLNKYYDELIDQYDYNSGMFKEYINILNNPSILNNFNDNTFIFDTNMKMLFIDYRCWDDNGYTFNNKDRLVQKLKEETSKKLSEIIVDALFADNIYNVWLNIREMLRYNNNLDVENKVIDSEKSAFYEMIFNFNNVSSEDKINLFNKLRDKNISTIFYEDLRRIKDYAYDKIKEDMINLIKYESNINKKYSDKYGINVYDLRNCKYTMMVRTLSSRYREETVNMRDCYSIISDENTNVYGENVIVYGYSSFDNDNIIHMLEKDSFSSNNYVSNDVTRFVNRIMTSREIVNSSNWYSEINIANSSNGTGKYKAMKPDFIVSYDKIRDIDIEEAKRLNIPIVVIRKTKLKDKDKIYIDFDSDIDVYNKKNRKK